MNPGPHLTDDALFAALVDRASEGKADELITGMIAVNGTAALLFLRGHISDAGIDPHHQRKACDDLQLAKAKAQKFAELAAAKLCSPDTPADTRASLAGAIACAVMTAIEMPLVVRACGANPVAASGMVSMGAQAILRDILHGGGS